MPDRKKKKTTLLRRLNTKYRVKIVSEEQFHEEASFRLSALQVFVIAGTTIILMVFLTIYLVAGTSLREYIPGYADTSSKKRLYELMVITDSLERQANANQLFLQNLQNIMLGNVSADSMINLKDTTKNFSHIRDIRSKEDSLLREQVQKEDQYNIASGDKKSEGAIGDFLFFSPLRGQVTDGFNKDIKHYGIDIAAAKNEAVKSVLDGTVILAGWTSETGYTIAIQHAENLVSIYKHNSVLLKRDGAFVKAGEPVAIVGNSGELTTGPHLHFELWYNGLPIDPGKFMIF